MSKEIGGENATSAGGVPSAPEMWAMITQLSQEVKELQRKVGELQQANESQASEMKKLSEKVSGGAKSPGQAQPSAGASSSSSSSQASGGGQQQQPTQQQMQQQQITNLTPEQRLKLKRMAVHLRTLPHADRQQAINAYSPEEKGLLIWYKKLQQQQPMQQQAGKEEREIGRIKEGLTDEKKSSFGQFLFKSRAINPQIGIGFSHAINGQVKAIKKAGIEALSGFLNSGSDEYKAVFMRMHNLYRKC